jgi:hypothetical protein
MMTTIFRSRRSLWGTLSACLLGVWIAGTSGFPKAFAQGAPAVDPQQRIRELEQRVKILELESETLDRRAQLEVERNARILDEMDKRVRALEARGPETRVPESSVPDPCRDPYIHVAPGVVRIRPGCESAGGECSAPEAVDARGVRTILPACQKFLDDNSRDCNPPYFIDAHGVKRFKTGCM